MLNIAAGCPMSEKLVQQPYVSPCGHAIEARVYAEDPLRNFLPSTGPLVIYREPQTALRAGKWAAPRAGGDGVRVDAGVVEGSTVSMFYDPMISKLITYGNNRDEALARMGTALDEYVIQGVSHNVPFLREVVRNQAFANGKYSTSFIGQEYPDGFSGVVLTKKETVHLAAVAALIYVEQAAMASSISGQLDSLATGVNHKMVEECVAVLGGPKGKPYHIHIQGETAQGPGQHGAKGGEDVEDGERAGGGGAWVFVVMEGLEWDVHSLLLRAFMDGEERIVQFLGVNGEGYNMAFAGSHQHVIVRSLREHELSQHMLPPVVVDHSSTLRCPMPGQVVSLAVEEGDHVEEGQALAVVEAMKMQNILRAQQRGRVLRLRCAEGDTLRVDAVMMEFDFGGNGGK
ncbi:unnamed protein product [Discosporangium mesarthrocarpum]